MEKINCQKIAVKTRVLDIALISVLLLIGCIVAPIALLHITWSLPINSQYFIGPTVNCALVFAALRLHGKFKTATLICAPSVCTLGLAFLPGITTVYGLMMVPAIWAGNAALVLTFKTLTNKITYIPTAVVAIALKVSIIFTAFLVLRTNGAFPTKIATALYTTMGVTQIITATCGCIAAFVALGLTRKRTK